jgi:lysine 2,3-aminomutase
MKTKSLHHIDQLVEIGLLAEATPELHAVAAQFSVSITPAMLALIEPGAADDPIAAQFVPDVRESTLTPDERVDPIGDDKFSPVEGIVHRYPDRVLLKLLQSCPVYCRFCFRREKIGPKQTGESGETLKEKQLSAALDYIRAHPKIWEVILTGGDPLLLSDRRLGEVIGELNAIDHVKIIRIHTRVPVVQPERITPQLIAALRNSKPVYVLLHCNHARELTNAARAACALLVEAGVPMLSQSVLLRGVNVEALRDLMRALVESRVKPHYLHHPDMARGTGHFRMPIAEGQALMRALRGHLSGVCQPVYILDIPGGYGKVPIGPVFASPDGEAWSIEDYLGTSHTY